MVQDDRHPGILSHHRINRFYFIRLMSWELGIQRRQHTLVASSIQFNKKRHLKRHLCYKDAYAPVSSPRQYTSVSPHSCRPLVGTNGRNTPSTCSHTPEQQAKTGCHTKVCTRVHLAHCHHCTGWAIRQHTMHICTSHLRIVRIHSRGILRRTPRIPQSPRILLIPTEWQLLTAVVD